MSDKLIKVEAETGVIGGILIEPDYMNEAAGFLNPNDFGVPIHRMIYQALLDLFRKGIPIDGTTLKSTLSDSDQLVVALKAAGAVPTASHTSEYIRIVKRAGNLRTAKERAIALIESIDAERTFETSQGLAADVLRAFDESNGASHIVSAKDGFLDFCASTNTPPKRFKTGFPVLDSILSIEPGSYVVVAGRPSSGKTAFTLQAAWMMAKDDKVLYFSLETDPHRLYERLISHVTQTNYDKIKRLDLADKDWICIQNYFPVFRDRNLEVVKASGYTVERIRGEIVKRKAKLVFIDYISLISAPGRSMLEKVTSISISLHNLAQQTGVAIVVLSQLNRAGSGSPGMENLRESGQLEQDADGILILGRESGEDTEKYTGRDNGSRAIYIVKNKDGECCGVRFQFIGELQTFKELPKK